MPKVLVLLFLIVLCCAVYADNPSAEKNVKSSNTSGSLSESASVPVSSSDAKKQLQQSQQPLEHVDAIHSKVDSKSSDSVKSVPKTQSSSSVDANPSVPKASVDIASQNSSGQAEGIVHSDPSEDFGRKLNPEALMRGFYVFIGLSVIVMAYIAWKGFGKRPAQIHRYGVVANREDLEMAPLDSDDGDGDEDDTTHFDISKHRLT